MDSLSKWLWDFPVDKISAHNYMECSSQGTPCHVEELHNVGELSQMSLAGKKNKKKSLHDTASRHIIQPSNSYYIKIWFQRNFKNNDRKSKKHGHFKTLGTSVPGTLLHVCPHYVGREKIYWKIISLILDMFFKILLVVIYVENL